MQGLLGEYQINLDAKGRLKLPVGYLKQLTPGEDKEFVLNRGFEKCLAFYTLSQWKMVSDQIEAKTNEYNTESRMLRRMLLSGATKLSPDGAGRILLPKGMIEHAGMKKGNHILRTDEQSGDMGCENAQGGELLYGTGDG